MKILSIYFTIHTLPPTILNNPSSCALVVAPRPPRRTSFSSSSFVHVLTNEFPLIIAHLPLLILVVFILVVLVLILVPCCPLSSSLSHVLFLSVFPHALNWLLLLSNILHNVTTNSHLIVVYLGQRQSRCHCLIIIIIPPPPPNPPPNIVTHLMLASCSNALALF